MPPPRSVLGAPSTVAAGSGPTTAVSGCTTRSAGSELDTACRTARQLGPRLLPCLHGQKVEEDLLRSTVPPWIPVGRRHAELNGGIETVVWRCSSPGTGSKGTRAQETASCCYSSTELLCGSCATGRESSRSSTAGPSNSRVLCRGAAPPTERARGSSTVGLANVRVLRHGAAPLAQRGGELDGAPPWRLVGGFESREETVRGERATVGESFK